MTKEPAGKVDPGQPLEPQIRGGVVRAALQRLGYDFDDERTARVREVMRMHLDAGMSAKDAFAEALEEELVMHGDPLKGKAKKRAEGLS